jgi:GT2 family glycosyltransferase
MLDRASMAAGWRVLRRHLRYARGDPRKLAWIVRRGWQILRGRRLGAVLDRHRLVDDLYRDYAAWLAEFERTLPARRAALRAIVAAASHPPRFSVLVPTYRPRREHFAEAVQSVRAQSYERWQLCIVDDGSPQRDHLDDLRALAKSDSRVQLVERRDNGGIARATNDALACADGDYVVLLDHDDRLDADALLELAAVCVERAGVDFVYADEDRLDESGRRCRPLFKPDWDPDWLAAHNWTLHPIVVRRALLVELGGLATDVDGAQDWDLLLRIAERVPPERIAHVPRVLYHWREHEGSTAASIFEKTGIDDAASRVMQRALERRGDGAIGEIVGQDRRIVHALPEPLPQVSLVIPTRDRAALLRACLDGIAGHTDYPDWQVVLVDNDTVEPEARALLDTHRADPRFRIVEHPGPFNYSALCNRGVEAASGEVVVLLNNDIEVIERGWLRELVSQALRPGVGLVGALLLYPDDTIQHAGVVLWLNGVADRPYLGRPGGFRGFDHRLAAVHGVSAMITACAAVRRSVYRAVGGMDESFPVVCNDLDLCLRVRARGLRNLLTPFARLRHRESASRGYHYDSPLSRQETADEARFEAQWRPRVPCDFAYNPNLSLSGQAYSLARPAAELPLPRREGEGVLTDPRNVV